MSFWNLKTDKNGKRYYVLSSVQIAIVSPLAIFVAALLAATLIPRLYDQCPPVNVKKNDKKIEQKWKGNDRFHVPKIVFCGEIATKFALISVEPISGLTCRIKYIGNEPIEPHFVFTSYDKNRKTLTISKNVLGPNKLNAGETGVFTFQENVASEIIELRQRKDDVSSLNNVTIELLPTSYTDTPVIINGEKHNVIFVAKLTNNTHDTLCFYEEWNSSGFWNLEFDLATANGAHIKIKRISMGWDANYPSFYLLKPNQSVFIPIYNYDEWWYWENMELLETARNGMVTAHYNEPSSETVADWDASSQGKLETFPSGMEKKIWIGSIKSISYNVADIMK
jgi:hypothetical protein